ncbi:hypothetical protein Ancab_029718 [Ancistrocladus abbreviatus]
MQLNLDAFTPNLLDICAILIAQSLEYNPSLFKPLKEEEATIKLDGDPRAMLEVGGKEMVPEVRDERMAEIKASRDERMAEIKAKHAQTTKVDVGVIPKKKPSFDLTL